MPATSNQRTWKMAPCLQMLFVRMVLQPRHYTFCYFFCFCLFTCLLNSWNLHMTWWSSALWRMSLHLEQLTLCCGENNMELNTLKPMEMTVDFRRISLLLCTSSGSSTCLHAYTILRVPVNLICMKNPRDKLQVAILARQMYPGNNKYFL